ncbi:DUF6522 family protein [Paracoccus sp. SJTW-4]|uniref:DUF6522 family protein n=1 Tax=Paracoccus sp. SJTW-4 TaxID=3078428 RepID=UPI0039EAFD48
MTQLEFGNDNVSIDAAVLARAFGISADDLKHGMRDGTITSRFERGEGEDAGRVRLLFFSPARRIRITADQSGKVLTCGAADLAGPPGFAGPAQAVDVGHAPLGAATLGSQAPEAAADDREARLEMLLELALQGTFPASDPIAISIEAPGRVSPPPGKAP